LSIKNPSLVTFNESFQRPVVSPLDFGRKKTAWQFSRFPVVSKALATNPFPGTRLVGAGAILAIYILITLSHLCPLAKTIFS